MIYRSGNPILLDRKFPLAILEHDGDFVGTLGFMPPEQQFGQFNRTTDLYSLGMSIVCWLSRKEPTEMRVTIIGTNNAYF